MKPILDVCCGSKMFWLDKQDNRCLYMDKRELETTLCDGRILKIKPDIVADFRAMPFDDNTFHLVIFDPPHLRKAGEKSWLAQKYGTLDPIHWQDDLTKAFKECFRVLKPFGTLIFKWNEDQIKLSKILKLTDQKPLISHQRQKTHFVVFMKADKE